MRFFRLPTKYRLNLQSRFTFSFTLLALGILVPILLLIEKHQSDAILSETVKRGIAVGNSIKAVTTNSLLAYDYLALEQAAKMAVKEGISYVVIMDKEGVVAGVGGTAVHTAGSKPDDPVSAAAYRAKRILVQETGIPERNAGADSRIKSSPVLDIAIPVFVEGSSTKWGTVRVGLSLEPVIRDRRQTLATIGLIGLLAIVASVMGARLLARRITRPVNRLVEATIEMARGNLEHRINIKTGDELEKLSDNFNNMASQIDQKTRHLASALKQLENLNQMLEQKVEDRTKMLAESEEKYRALVENSPDPHMILLNDRMVYFNRAFLEATQHTEDEVKQESFDFYQYLPPEDRETVRNALSLSLEGKALPDHEISLISKDGSERKFVFRCRKIKFLNNPAVQIVLVDITERKRLQEQVVQYERLRALGEMAGGVAHDFNNLLGIILGRAQLLQARLTDEKARKGLEIIAKAAIDGGTIVKRIQEFARVRKERNFAPVDMRALVADVIEITKSRWKDEAQARGVRYEVKQDLRPTPNVMANESEIREVLTNIVFNAIDAMPDGGRLSLSTNTVRDKAVVSISDTGVGMPEEVKQKVFDPFFSTKGPKGMGLGLSTAYGVIKRHRGKIEVESTLGKGSTFLISLPATKAAQLQAPEALDKSALARLQILVIDDETEIGELLADILTEGGHKVETAGGGVEGVKKFSAGSFQAVLTDLGMPDMSGWEVAEAIRTKDPGVIIGLVTGWGASIDPEKIERMGIDFLLSKPFQTRDILEKLAAAQMRKAASRKTVTR